MSGPIKLLLSYDIPAENEETYYRYVTGKFVPQAHELGLELAEVWHTAYGEYPARLIVFVARDNDTAKLALGSEQWQKMQKRLMNFVTGFELKLVDYRDHFQF